MQSDVLSQLTALARPFIESLGLVLWGAEVVPGSRPVVRVFLDGPQGVDVEQCAQVSRQLGLALDVEDFIHGPYQLEVSSPGLSRRFFDFSQLPPYLGREVELTLAEPRDGRKRFKGVLASLEGDTLTLDHEGTSSVFSWGEVAKAKLIHVFPAPARG